MMRSTTLPPARRSCAALLLALITIHWLPAGAFAQTDSYECGSEFFSPLTLTELAKSRKAEALLMGAAMSEWEFMQTEDTRDAGLSREFFLGRALELHPENELVQLRAAIHCDTRVQNSSLCLSKHAEQLPKLDPDNGYYWTARALQLYADGAAQETVEHLERGAEAPYFSIGFGRSVMAFRAFIVSEQPPEATCAFELASGLAASSIPRFEPILQTCRARLADVRWQNACAALGASMEHRGRSLVTAMIGFAVQKVMFEAHNSSDQLKALADRKSELEALSERFRQMEPDLRSSAAAQELWLRDLLAEGEIEAMRRFIKRDR